MRARQLLIPLLVATCAAPTVQQPQRAESALAKPVDVAPVEVEPAPALEASPPERALPAEPVDLQRARTDLAATLVALGDLAGARALYEDVLETALRTLPDGHPSVRGARSHLAWLIALEIVQARGTLMQQSGADDSTSAALQTCTNLVLANLRASSSMARDVIAKSSAREAEERCTAVSRELDRALSIASALEAFQGTHALDSESFVLSESMRAAGIQTVAFARAAATSPQGGAPRAQIQRSAAKLAAPAQQGSAQEEFDRSLHARDSAQRELAGLSVASSDGLGVGLSIDADSVAARLGSDGAAVVFRRYRWTRIEYAEGARLARESSAEVMCAFVVRNSAPDADGKVSALLRRIELGPIDAIEEAVRAWRDTIGVGVSARDGADPVGASSPMESDALGAALRARVFDPLRGELAGIERLVVVLDDVLHLVPLDALPVDESTRIGDHWKYQLHATLSELVRPAERRDGSGPLVVFGDVDFGPLAVASDTAGPAPSTARIRGSSRPRSFIALPASRAEVRGIVEHFQEQYGAEAAVERCVGADATRERLIEWAPQARWLHVATHGWFEPESIRSWTDPDPNGARLPIGARLSGVEQVRGMSPLLLCGLALAGANSAPDATGRIHGWITGEEIAALDLTNCELAVLAGGDTNIGERRAGQGVASLQKALQMAGARSVITSLWKVPDEATKELMLDFYRRLWVERKPKWQALWEAKTKLREAKAERGEPKYTTRDWAAWVLTGESD